MVHVALGYSEMSAQTRVQLNTDTEGQRSNSRSVSTHRQCTLTPTRARSLALPAQEA